MCFQVCYRDPPFLVVQSNTACAPTGARQQGEGTGGSSRARLRYALLLLCNKKRGGDTESGAGRGGRGGKGRLLPPFSSPCLLYTSYDHEHGGCLLAVDLAYHKCLLDFPRGVGTSRRYCVMTIFVLFFSMTVDALVVYHIWRAMIGCKDI